MVSSSRRNSFFIEYDYANDLEKSVREPFCFFLSCFARFQILQLHTYYIFSRLQLLVLVKSKRCVTNLHSPAFSITHFCWRKKRKMWLPEDVRMQKLLPAGSTSLSAQKVRVTTAWPKKNEQKEMRKLIFHESPQSCMALFIWPWCFDTPRRVLCKPHQASLAAHAVVHNFTRNFASGAPHFVCFCWAHRLWRPPPPSYLQYSLHPASAAQTRPLRPH